MSDSTLTTAAALFKALAHPVRLRVLAMLRAGELCVCQLTAIAGLAYSTMSVHLRELRRAGLIEERKEGRWVYYRLTSEPRASALLDEVFRRAANDPQVAADVRVLGRVCCFPPEEVCKAGLDPDRLPAKEA